MSRFARIALGIALLWLATILIDRCSSTGEPLTLPVKPVPEVVLADLEQINATSTGPNDFAAMGKATAAMIRVLSAADQLENVGLTASNFSVDSAVLHLFPFVSTRHWQAFTNLQHHAPGSKGLVIPCGDSDFHVAMHLVVAVRHVFKSSLPIEIMFAGDADLNTTRQKALEAAADDVKAINVLEFFDESIVGLKGGGWAIKPFAILASSFEQVIIADADVVFVQTPELALDHPGFRRTGTLFYHDRVIHFNDDMHAWWRDIMGPKQPSTMMQQSLFWSRQTSFEMESGVVAFNKSRIEVLLGMLFTAWMNTQSVRDQTTYRHTHGDKESYWMAFELAGIPYFYDNVYASAIGHITKDGDSGQDKLCPSHILHLDNTGRPFWYNGSLYLNKKDKKADRKWMHPTVWALASGKWLGGVCLLQPDAHALSDGGYDIVYQQMVQAAEQANADVDALIA